MLVLVGKLFLQITILSDKDLGVSIRPNYVIRFFK